MNTCIIGGSRGAPRHVPPQQDQFLSFSHMFSPKSVRIRGWHPPNGSVPPQQKILDPPLCNRNTFGEANIQYHDFDNQDSLTFTDKYTALLKQELQNPDWNLHDPIMTKSYQISKDMDIEMMPHAMYFTSDPDTVTKINHVPYQTIKYNDNGMFTTKLMNDTPIKIFITMELHPPYYLYALTTTFPFYMCIPEQKVISLSYGRRSN